MTNNEFRNILNDEENLLSKEELDLLINAELAKPEEFNNDDKKERDGEIKTKKKKRVLTRIIAIAAAVAVIIAGAVSASTGMHKTNVKEGIVEFYRDYIQINFSGSENRKQEFKSSDSKLIKELADNGISPVVLPEALLSEDYKIERLEYEDTEYIKSANIMLKQKRKKVNITISRYDEAIGLPDMEYMNTEGLEKITVDGVDVYVIIRDDDYKGITYVDRDMYYSIVAEWDIETALEIAKTIK